LEKIGKTGKGVYYQLNTGAKGAFLSNNEGTGSALDGLLPNVEGSTLDSC
jgi:hypothetical protein